MEGFEADKLACVWLVKRFIEPDAEFLFFPKQKIIDRGIAFDTPNSRFKRTYNQSAFEAFIAHYRLSDPRLAQIALWIHDIEINVWEKKAFAQSRKIEIFVMDLVRSGGDDRTIIEKATVFFDGLYEQIPQKK